MKKITMNIISNTDDDEGSSHIIYESDFVLYVAHMM